MEGVTQGINMGVSSGLVGGAMEGVNSAADGNSFDEILKDALVGSWDWPKWDIGAGLVSGSGSKPFDASMGRLGGKDSIIDDVARASDDIVDGVSSGGKGVSNGDGVVDDIVSTLRIHKREKKRENIMPQE